LREPRRDGEGEGKDEGKRKEKIGKERKGHGMIARRGKLEYRGVGLAPLSQNLDPPL